ncbi:MAG: CpsB/CapC family capsule biosynthesis tyrosine phosphatase [Acutalibacteraceae bacterium]|nr:CpsB/CapC family capsule biosynthesis tyrosine phosphatase [Acutalibacteraceae bacterium]
MTDLHTHILYGLDDGAVNLEMSLKMLEIAKKNGTENITFTPHCNIPNGYINYIDDVIVGRFEKLKRISKERKIGVNLYLGMEVYASNDIDRLIMDGAVITLNNSRYMLIEFPFDANPMWVGYVLDKVQRLGVIPLLAHPERYPYVQDFPYMVYDWVSSGCLIQINRGSIVGRFGEAARDIAIMFMRDDLVSAVASDAHRPEQRTPVLKDAYDWVSKYFSERYAKKIFVDKPMSILKNKPPEPPRIIQF